MFLLVAMTAVSQSFVPALFFLATMVVSGAGRDRCSARGWSASARRTVAARAAFATALVSSLSAARTVKLAGATRPVLDHLARLDRDRSDRQRREIAIQVWARSTPSVVSGLLPIARLGAVPGAAACRAGGDPGRGGHARRGPVVRLDHRVAGVAAAVGPGVDPAHGGDGRRGDYSAAVPGVDISAGTAPAPPTAPRNPLRRLELRRLQRGARGRHGRRAATST